MKKNDPNQMRVLLTCGGTGGHIMPALAVAEELKIQFPSISLLFVGTPDRMESQIVPKAGYSFRAIESSGFSRSFSWPGIKKNLKTLLRLASFSPLRKAFKIFKDFQPDLVLGTGGYVTGPVLLAAALKGIPTMLLEQNVNPGLTNRLLASVVKKIGLPFESKHPLWVKHQKKCIVVGNPVRRQILEATRAEGQAIFGLEPGKKTITCIGGSLGSKVLNEAFVELAQNLDGIQAVHGCGHRFKEEMAAKNFQAKAAPYRQLDFIEQMGALYAATDLLICRAGATTLAEATAKGVPMILIPWEAASNAEQRHNAQPLAQAKAALLLSDSDLESKALIPTVRGILEKQGCLEEMASRSQAFGKPEASKLVVQELISMLKHQSQ